MRWLGILAALLLGSGLLASLLAGRFIGGKIEKAGSAALGVPTRVGLVFLRPLTGQIGLTSLSVANPSGFETPRFLQLGSVRVDVGMRALTTSPIEIRRIELADIDLYLERKNGQTNYGKVLEGASRGTPAASADSGPTVVVQELVIRDIRAHTSLAPGGKLTEFDVEIPELRLQNLGKPGSGMTSVELMTTLTRAVMEAVARKATGLPSQLASDLNRRARKLPGVDLVLSGEAAGAAAGAQKSLLEAGERARNALGELFGKPD